MQTVTSKDGTKIAYDKTGQGPAVILVAGAMGTRSFGHADLAKLLSSSFTVYNYDRRGRGDSTDTQPYAVEREIEDIEALIDEAYGTACLYGISSGACLVLEAAFRLGDKVNKIALYEPPYNSDPADRPIWQAYYTKLKDLVVAGQRGKAVEHFMKFLQVPDNMIEGMRKQPMWPGLEAVARTLIYDAQAMGVDTRAVPTELAKKVKVPALVMDGEETFAMYPFMRASADELARALPNAKRQTLEGQRHDVSSEVLAPVLTKFFTQES
ncbi:MAG TPA: alpha/beta fold hydrolase [Verrucomicrobiae bacterium]|nr:alpha/beta fold hydrolase [Verrucomicrobiae bacterium]